jgi:hypothetical protein
MFLPHYLAQSNSLAADCHDRAVFIKGVQKVSVRLMITMQKVTNNVLASLLGSI